MHTKPGSLEHFGQIFYPLSLIGVVTNEVVETTYKEIVTLTDDEKHALARAISGKAEPVDGEQTVFVSLDFEDRIVDGTVRVRRSTDCSGHLLISIDWHQLTETSENSKQCEVMIDTYEMNRKYLLCY